MSQEYTEDKHIKFKALSSGRRLLEAILLAIVLGAIFLIVALVSFSPSDPSWSQTTWNEPVKNLGGSIGSWSADILFSAFGVLAFAIPPLLIMGCWSIYRYQSTRRFIDFFSLSLRLIGALALILTSCGLAALNSDDLPNFASGGVIGSVFSNALMPWFNSLGATLALICLWAIGFTLFTGWSWLTVAEKIGAVILVPLTLLTNRARGDEDDYDYREDDEYEDDEREQADGEYHEQDPLIQSTVSAEDVYHAPIERDEQDIDDILFSSPTISELAHVELFSAPDVSQLEPEVKETIAATITQPPAPIDRVSADANRQVQPQAQTPIQSLPSSESAQLPRFSANNAENEAERYHFEIPDDYQSNHSYVTENSSDGEFEPSLGDLSQQNFIPPQNSQQNNPLVSDFEPTPFVSNSFISQPVKSEPSTAVIENLPEIRIDEPDSSNIMPSKTTSDLMKRQAALAAAGISVAALERHSQIKQGLGPELPRPNPVRLPTRRERYGIHIQSEVQRRKEEAEQQRENSHEEWSENDELQQLDEAELRKQFLRQQQERYGDESDIDIGGYNDENSNLAEPTNSAIEHQTRIEPVLTQPEIIHRWPAATKDIPSQPEMPNYRAISASDEQFDAYQAREDADYVQLQNERELEQQNQQHAQQYRETLAGLSALDDFSPVEDLVNDQPAEPIFTPSFSIKTVTETDLPPSVPVVDFAQQPQQPEPPKAQPQPIAQQDSLFHPFLVRNDQPLPKSTTPMPSLDLLASPPLHAEPVDMFALEQTSRLIEARLNDYRVKADVVGFSPGPVITRFELDLAPGVKAARISNLSRDLARSLSATAVRIVEVIPGKPYVGLELPNQKRQTVYLREVLDCDQFRNDPSPLTIVLGKDIEGEPVVADLGKMPHLLVAGTTGSGKSVGVNAMILSILYKSKPEDVRFIMIDPKMLELSIYEGIPHLLTEVVTDMKDAANALRWCVNEMERRYKLMSALGVRNLAGYNDRIKEADVMGRPIPHPFWKPGDTMDVEHPVLKKEPYIVVMVDEFADLMMTAGKKVEELIARLAQKARAAGIHLVLATQRPSVDIITGLIKANIPTRIAFTVSSKIDSRTILDQSGAESLLGMGDMLYLPPNSSIPIRVHGAFVRDQEVHAVVNDWKARGKPQYIDSIVKCSDESEGSGGSDGGAEELDPLFDQAVEFVIEKQRVSISGVQRQFRIGYNRAARIVEQMEAQSIVSEPGHNGNREVLSQQPMGH